MVLDNTIKEKITNFVNNIKQEIKANNQGEMQISNLYDLLKNSDADFITFFCDESRNQIIDENGDNLWEPGLNLGLIENRGIKKILLYTNANTLYENFPNLYGLEQIIIIAPYAINAGNLLATPNGDLGFSISLVLPNATSCDGMLGGAVGLESIDLYLPSAINCENMLGNNDEIHSVKLNLPKCKFPPNLFNLGLEIIDLTIYDTLSPLDDISTIANRQSSREDWHFYCAEVKNFKITILSNESYIHYGLFENCENLEYLDINIRADSEAIDPLFLVYMADSMSNYLVHLKEIKINGEVVLNEDNREDILDEYYNGDQQA